MDLPARKGRFAFEYDAASVLKDIDWFRQFDIFVPGSFLKPDAVKEFHASGTKLFVYDWTVAFYGNSLNEFSSYVLHTHPEWLLNNGQPTRKIPEWLEETPSPDSPQVDIWYFDMGNRELVFARAEYLEAQLRQHGYDGIFFDCVGTFDHAREPHIPQLNLKFNARHPGMEYSDGISHFFSILKQKLGARHIFTNQGYRNAGRYLQHSDFDLSESYMTSWAHARELTIGKHVFKLTHFVPWSKQGSLFESTNFIVPACITSHLDKFGLKTEVMHLNYAYPSIDINTGKKMPDREAIFYAVAAASMFGHSAYVRNQETPADPALNHDNLYFFELGKPTGPMSDTGTWAVREFENAVALINNSGKDLALEELAQPKLLDCHYLDLFTNQILRGSEFAVPFHRQEDGAVTSSARILYKI